MTSQDENSSTLEPEDPLERLILEYSLTPQEQERRRQGAIRLSERLSSIPWHRERAERAERLEPGGAARYWETLYASCVLA